MERLSDRRKARMAVLEILYQLEMSGYPLEKILNEKLYSERYQPLSDFARRLIDGVNANRSRIEALVENHAEKWTVQRMPLVDLNTMRLAVYELVFEPEIPANVSINEAVELARVFGGQDSAKFVNGVLGKIAAELKGGKLE